MYKYQDTTATTFSMELQVDQYPQGIVIYGSSDNSSDIYSNNAYNFSINLPERLKFHGDWVAAITEFEGVIPNNSRFIDIHINIIGESIVGDFKRTIARRIFKSASSNRRIAHQAFAVEYYTPLKLLEFETIKVEIVNQLGYQPNIVKEATNIVIHIKPNI